jgi:hypothetical protein
VVVFPLLRGSLSDAISYRPGLSGLRFDGPVTPGR